MSLQNWLRSSIYLIFVGFVGFVLSPSLALQVGVVDDIVILRSSPLQALIKPGQAKVTACEKELEALSTQLQQSKAEFDKNEMIMNPATRAQKEKALFTLGKQWQAKMVALETERNILRNRIEQCLQDAFVKVAKQQKLNILFSKMRGVVYADTTLDLTKQVIDKLPKRTVEATDTVLDMKVQASTD